MINLNTISRVSIDRSFKKYLVLVLLLLFTSSAMAKVTTLEKANDEYIVFYQDALTLKYSGNGQLPFRSWYLRADPTYIWNVRYDGSVDFTTLPSTIEQQGSWTNGQVIEIDIMKVIRDRLEWSNMAQDDTKDIKGKHVVWRILFLLHEKDCTCFTLNVASQQYFTTIYVTYEQQSGSGGILNSTLPFQFSIFWLIIPGVISSKYRRSNR